MLKVKPIVVFDLDGTLISSNTFLIFLRYALKKSLFKGMITKVIFVIFALIRRKLGFIDRATLKQAMDRKLFSYYDDPEFLSLCFERINPQVYLVFKNLKKNSYCIVINSAALPYAKFLGEMFGSDQTMTSHMVNGKWVENNLDQKIASLDNYFGEGNYSVDQFYTDDLEEDKPLALISKEVFFVDELGSIDKIDVIKRE